MGLEDDMDFYRIQKVLQDGCHDFRITRPNILFPFFLGLLSSVVRIYILLRAYTIFPAFLFFFRGLLINIVLILVTSFTVFFALLNTLEAWGFRYKGVSGTNDPYNNTPNVLWFKNKL